MVKVTGHETLDINITRELKNMFLEWRAIDVAAICVTTNPPDNLNAQSLRTTDLVDKMGLNYKVADFHST